MNTLIVKPLMKFHKVNKKRH